MPKSLLMSDLCIIQLAKKYKKLDKKTKLYNFIQLQPNLNKFIDKIFIYI